MGSNFNAGKMESNLIQLICMLQMYGTLISLDLWAVTWMRAQPTSTISHKVWHKNVVNQKYQHQKYIDWLILVVKNWHCQKLVGFSPIGSP